MVGMDENHRTLLRKNRMHLIRDLDGDRVASHLYSKEIFSEEDKALVNAEKTPQQKGEVLLDLLQRRGASAFEVFCDVLRELKMFHLEILLRNDEMTSPSIEKGIDVEDRAGIMSHLIFLFIKKAFIFETKPIKRHCSRLVPNFSKRMLIV